MIRIEVRKQNTKFNTTNIMFKYDTEEKAWDYLLRILSRRNYGSWELQKKLTERSSLTQNQIKLLVEKLNKLKLINDNGYTSSKFKNKINKKNKSPLLISQELKQRTNRS